MSIITLIMTLIVFVLTLLSCISDVRSMRIANWYSLAIVGCFVPAWLATPELFHSIAQQAGALGLMFAVTYIMFSYGMMGGGDSKYASALALWIGLKGLMPFMFYMALMGGVVGLATLFIRKYKPFKNPPEGSWMEQAQAEKNVVPYGVAISFGAWAAFFHTGFVHNQLNEVIKIIH